MSAETSASGPRSSQLAWFWVVGVVGLDYFSTLAYVPSITYQAAGRLAPLVTLAMVVITLIGAVPVYRYLAKRSPGGHGGVVLLERALPGWKGKLLLLIVLGFGATDLIFTRTFSTADAAEHLIHAPSPAWQRTLGDWSQNWGESRVDLPEGAKRWTSRYSDRHFVVTMMLLSAGMVVGVIFIRGVNRWFVRLAVGSTIIYLGITSIVIGAGVVKLIGEPRYLADWWSAVQSGDWSAKAVPGEGHSAGTPGLVRTAFLLFPTAALGLSGFEMALLVMPLIRGRSGRGGDGEPDDEAVRVRGTRRLLLVSAVIAGVFTIGASFVTTLFVPVSAIHAEGQAANRALAFLAHGGGAEPLAPFFGLTFGTIHDTATVWILCLAGVSVTMTLAKLVPPYLQKLGMEFEWSRRLGLMVYVFTLVKIAVLVVYGADLDDQRAAYTISVLVLFLSAAFAAFLDRWHHHRLSALLFLPVFVVFCYAAGREMLENPSGIAITGVIVGALLLLSIATRSWRSMELRFKGFEFANEESRTVFHDLKTLNFPMLVPHRRGFIGLVEREQSIRKVHRIPAEMPLVFLAVELGDPSEFNQLPLVNVVREEGRVVIQITRAASVAHTVAAVAIEMSRVGVAPEIHFGWSDENPVSANLNFLLFGQGNVPWLVYQLIRGSGLPKSQLPHVLVG